MSEVEDRANLIKLLQALPEKFNIDGLTNRFSDKPRESLLIMVGLAAVAFYLSERGKNKNVNDVFDALEYCTSSLSVGYTDVYPQSPIGKVIGSTLMTVGPSLVTNFLRQKVEPDPKQEEILATLKEILHELKSRPATQP